MNRDQDWTLKEIAKYCGSPPDISLKVWIHTSNVLKMLRRAQARERAAWRKALRKLQIKYRINPSYGPRVNEAYSERGIALSDLDTAMKGRKG